MPAAGVILAGAAIVGAGAAVVGTVKTIDAQNKMAKAQRQQYKYERQLNQNRAVRERRDAIRAARISSANLVQTGENSGGSGTSAFLGGLGSIQTQLNNNLSFLDTQQSLADKASVQSQKAAAAANSAQKWGTVTDLGMAVFNTSQTLKKK